LAGFPCRFVANAVVQHLGSATTGGHGSDFCVFYGNRNVVWLTLKNFPLVLLPLAILGHLAIALLLALQMLGRGQLGVFLRGKWAGLRQISGAWRARRTVRRKISLGQLVKSLSWP
jgi:GT2 family glycosyltransferase